MRPGLLSFISEIKSIPGIRDLSMTTNGSRLKEYAFALKNAGLDRINISLDTLQSQRFLSITGCDMFNRVIEGINVAEQVGLLPIKINVVVVYGINNDELVDFARMTRNNSYQIRFIECMPFWPNSTNPKRLVPVVEMKEILASGGFRILEAEPSDSGPAQVYRIPGALGTLGFISPVTNHFCGSCNRIRLTSDGRIRPCLISNDEFNIKALLRSGASDSDIETHLK